MCWSGYMQYPAELHLYEWLLADDEAGLAPWCGGFRFYVALAMQPDVNWTPSYVVRFERNKS